MMRPAYMQRKKRQAQKTVILAILVWVAATAACKRHKSPSADNPDKAAPTLSPTHAMLSDLATWCGQRWQGATPPYPQSLATPAHGAYLAARKDGEELTSAWGAGPTMGDALADAIGKLGNNARYATALEIFIAAEATPVAGKNIKSRLLSNIHRGVIGIEEARDGKEPARHSPTAVISTNRSHKKLLGQVEDTSQSVAYQILSGPQILVDLEAGQAHIMERGNTHVAPDAVTDINVKSFAKGMGQWMWSNLHPDGRMTYLYWPSQGREAPGRNNLIRQFMATIALGRLASHEDNDTLWERSATNIDFNLQNYYREDEGHGLVELRGKVKLGAVALAALAIVEHKDRQRWSVQEAALRRTVDSLWREDGSFRTFFQPKERNDNQNFYPGEALLLWATLYSQTKEPALLAKIMQSFAYYHRWHLDAAVPDRRNPAFIPWHTQAYFMVWQHTKDEGLREFIFEMNDWLLDVQQWDSAVYPDTQGRFYAPDQDYGPPHASATGVYLESLVDAHSLARQIGDTARVKKYSEAIHRGLRSSMQLQFDDDIDLFYISKKERVRGGLRTTVYDNQIRCDNVQHTLMGTLKILETGVLTR